MSTARAKPVPAPRAREIAPLSDGGIRFLMRRRRPVHLPDAGSAWEVGGRRTYPGRAALFGGHEQRDAVLLVHDQAAAVLAGAADGLALGALARDLARLDRRRRVRAQLLIRRVSRRDDELPG